MTIGSYKLTSATMCGPVSHWCPVDLLQVCCPVTCIMSVKLSHRRDMAYNVLVGRQHEKMTCCQWPSTKVEDVLLLGGAACEDTRQEVARCCPVSVFQELTDSSGP